MLLVRESFFLAFHLLTHEKWGTAIINIMTTNAVVMHTVGIKNTGDKNWK